MSGWVQKRQSGRWMARYRAPDGKTRSKRPGTAKPTLSDGSGPSWGAETVANGLTRSSGRHDSASGP